MAHKFKITPAANEQFKFAFVYNAETIFWSENYKQKASAKSAVDSLKKNAPAAATAYAGNNRNLVTWPVVPGATSYQVLRSTTSGSGYVSVTNGVVGPVCGSGS